MSDGSKGDGQPFDGGHYQLGRALNLPQVLSRPHPPIMIAGSGEQKTLRLVVRYGDACNLYPFPDAIRHKLEVLRRHFEAEGRDDDEIEETSSVNFNVGEDGSKTGELIEHLHRLADIGIETVFGRVAYAERITRIEIMGREVIPVVAEFWEASITLMEWRTKSVFDRGDLKHSGTYWLRRTHVESPAASKPLVTRSSVS